MKYRRIILISLVSLGIFGMAPPAPSEEETNGYNLQRTEIQGYVDRVQEQEAWILTDEGDEYKVQLGPESYWDDHDYYLPEGEYVRMEVWYDPYGYTDWYFAGEIWGPGFHMVLTDSYGVPYWVTVDEDYYYGLGYRASCVSYMIWFDLPPTYFVYVILPPPPPWDYGWYYGPRWRYHHDEWCHYGDRYDYGSRDRWGDGHDRTPRSGRRIRGYDRDGNNGSPSEPPTLPIEGKQPYTPRPPKYTNPGNVTPRVKAQPRNQDEWKRQATKSQPRNNDVWQKRNTKPQSRYDQKHRQPVTTPRNEQKYRKPVTTPRNEYRYQKRDVPSPSERRTYARQSEPVKRQYPREMKSPRSERRVEAPPSRPQVKEQKAPDRKSPAREYSRPQVSKQRSEARSEKRDSGSRRSNSDHRNRHR